MNNFITEQLETYGHFTYWHRHVVTEKEINIALEKKITIEIDIAFDEKTDSVFIGHPLSYYTKVIHKPYPQNISLEQLKDTLRNSTINVVFDCKDIRVFPVLIQLIQEFGSSRFAFHSFIKEWSEAYPPNIKVQNHWILENISIEEISKFRESTRTFWIGTIRGFSYNWLTNTYPVETITNTAKNKLDAIAVFFPIRFLPFPPYGYFNKFVGEGFYPVLHTDLVLGKIPFPYIGLTEFSSKCTKI